MDFTIVIDINPKEFESSCFPEFLETVKNLGARLLFQEEKKVIEEVKYYDVFDDETTVFNYEHSVMHYSFTCDEEKYKDIHLFFTLMHTLDLEFEVEK